LAARPPRRQPAGRLLIALAHPALAIAVEVAEHRIEVDSIDGDLMQLEQQAQQATPNLSGKHADFAQHGDVSEIGETHFPPEDRRVIGLEAAGGRDQFRRGRLLQARADSERAESRRFTLGPGSHRATRSPPGADSARQWDPQPATALPSAWVS